MCKSLDVVRGIAARCALSMCEGTKSWSETLSWMTTALHGPQLHGLWLGKAWGLCVVILTNQNGDFTITHTDVYIYIYIGIIMGYNGYISIYNYTWVCLKMGYT